MLLIIPVIKLSHGTIVDSIFGEEHMKCFYEKLKAHPEKLANLLRRENSKSIMFFDYDSFLKEDNTANLDVIARATNSIDIPIQYVTRIANVEYAEKLLESGIYRIFIDDVLLQDTDAISYLVRRYSSSRISAYFLFRNGMLIPSDKKNIFSVTEWVEMARKGGIARMLYAEHEVIQQSVDYDFEQVYKFAQSIQMQLTLLEGVHTSSLLHKFNQAFPPYIDSVALGKALWENYFPCQKIWRLVEGQLEENDNVITTAGELIKNILPD